KEVGEDVGSQGDVPARTRAFHAPDQPSLQPFVARSSIDKRRRHGLIRTQHMCFIGVRGTVVPEGSLVLSYGFRFSQVCGVPPDLPHKVNEIKREPNDIKSKKPQNKTENETTNRVCSANLAEGDIKAIKQHMLSVMASAAPDFPWSAWNEMLPRVLTTLNLRTSNSTPSSQPMRTFD
ncbi:hypothetical protein THAOC_31477, partial [Thalassiosira oceanica]